MRTGQSDSNGCLKRVLIYRQKWESKTAQEINQYGIDGCTRWFPGSHFVAVWNPRKSLDPGLEGFIRHNSAVFLQDPDAQDK
eukprot:16451484-Heterocapsa_arctica.AAC.1